MLPQTVWRTVIQPSPLQPLLKRNSQYHEAAAQAVNLGLRSVLI